MKVNLVNLNYKDRKNLSISISIICLWTMILFFFGRMINTEIENLNYKADEEQTQLIAYNDFIAKNNNLDVYTQKVALNLELIKNKIPNNMAQNQFLAQLNDIAQLSQVDIIELIPTESVNQETYQQQEFSLIIQGDYFAILDFCHQLNLNNRLVSIQYGKIFIQNQAINAKLTLQIYANN